MTGMRMFNPDEFDVMTECNYHIATEQRLTQLLDQATAAFFDATCPYCHDEAVTEFGPDEIEITCINYGETCNFRVVIQGPDIDDFIDSAVY